MLLKDFCDLIRTEPELPGEPTDNLIEVFNRIIEDKDLDSMVSLLRQTVHMTKVGILKRVINKVEQEELI